MCADREALHAMFTSETRLDIFIQMNKLKKMMIVMIHINVWPIFSTREGGPASILNKYVNKNWD